MARVTSYEVPFSTILSSLLPLSSKHAPQHPVLEHLKSMSFPQREIPSLWLNINVGRNLGDIWLQSGMTVMCLDCDIIWTTAMQGNNRILNDRRNCRRVSYTNKAGQITQSGLNIDIEMLYKARLYQQGDARFTQRIKSECHFCLLIIRTWSIFSYYHLLLSLNTKLGFICFWLSRKLLSFAGLFAIKNIKWT